MAPTVLIKQQMHVALGIVNHVNGPTFLFKFQTVLWRAKVKSDVYAISDQIMGKVSHRMCC